MKVYADNGFHGHANREFLHIKDMGSDGIMPQGREEGDPDGDGDHMVQKMISKVRCKFELYFGVTAIRQRAESARFITLAKEGVLGFVTPLRSTSRDHTLQGSGRPFFVMLPKDRCVWRMGGATQGRRKRGRVGTRNSLNLRVMND